MFHRFGEKVNEEQTRRDNIKKHLGFEKYDKKCQ
jgi:hypothetical protein